MSGAKIAWRLVIRPAEGLCPMVKISPPRSAWLGSSRRFHAARRSAVSARCRPPRPRKDEAHETWESPPRAWGERRKDDEVGAMQAYQGSLSFGVKGESERALALVSARRSWP